MNDIDHKDYSVWCSFFENETAFVSNAVIDQMMADMEGELELRDGAPQDGE